MGSRSPESEVRLDGGNGAVVVGPEAARWAGARMRRLACIKCTLSAGGKKIKIGRREITYVDHPVGDLAHAEARGVAELLLLLFTGIRVVRVTVKPGLEVVSGLLGELATLAGGTVGEGRGGHRVWRARGRGDRNVGGTELRGVVGVSLREAKLGRIWKRPLALYP